uniref:Uncharacterized protein n=1 Tax=Arion vulgaris TaxID=1028688 RepID=A0A0B6Y678_9EUPU
MVKSQYSPFFTHPAEDLYPDFLSIGKIQNPCCSKYLNDMPLRLLIEIGSNCGGALSA